MFWEKSIGQRSSMNTEEASRYVRSPKCPRKVRIPDETVYISRRMMCNESDERWEISPRTARSLTPPPPRYYVLRTRSLHKFFVRRTRRVVAWLVTRFEFCSFSREFAELSFAWTTGVSNSRAWAYRYYVIDDDGDLLVTRDGGILMVQAQREIKKKINI